MYLPIKQVYFDAIIDGSKKEEYREIKDTTYKKYLQCDEYGLLYDADLIDAKDPNLGDPMAWNNGNFPYFPKLYQYLSLAVGYAKERDTALVKVTGYSFFPAEDEEGKVERYSLDGNRLTRDDNGDLCPWIIAYRLGEVVELHRKGE
ncbi:MAG: ASCH domain-containing protein [Bacteroidales bacterium]|nr:ASCH domain-containing protein [Bacteroidales bacterium]